MGASDSIISPVPARLLRAVLDEIAQACVEEDHDLLKAVGLVDDSDMKVAEHLVRSDRKRLSRAVAAVRSPVTIDVTALRYLLVTQVQESECDRRVRDLIRAGATGRMFEELGLDSRAFRGVRRRMNPDLPIGRPSRVNDGVIQRMIRYWTTCVNPERVHPIDHLLRTAEHLDVRITHVWEHVSSMERRASIGEERQRFEWVIGMFPRWDWSAVKAPES